MLSFLCKKLSLRKPELCHVSMEMGQSETTQVGRSAHICYFLVLIF